MVSTFLSYYRGALVIKFLEFFYFDNSAAINTANKLSKI